MIASTNDDKHNLEIKYSQLSKWIKLIGKISMNNIDIANEISLA